MPPGLKRPPVGFLMQGGDNSAGLSTPRLSKSKGGMGTKTERYLREERRVITALSADLVGSTALATRLDPEDAPEIIGGDLTRIIGRHRGRDSTGWGRMERGGVLIPRCLP
jgi:class 3 adenylate cyclase